MAGNPASENRQSAALTVVGLDDGSDDRSDPAFGVGAETGVGSVDIRAKCEVSDIEDMDDITMIPAGIVRSL